MENKTSLIILIVFVSAFALGRASVHKTIETKTEYVEKIVEVKSEDQLINRVIVETESKDGTKSKKTTEKIASFKASNKNYVSSLNTEKIVSNTLSHTVSLLLSPSSQTPYGILYQNHTNFLTLPISLGVGLQTNSNLTLNFIGTVGVSF